MGVASCSPEVGELGVKRAPEKIALKSTGGRLRIDGGVDAVKDTRDTAEDMRLLELDVGEETERVSGGVGDVTTVVDCYEVKEAGRR
jgi:hypothetical protein